jgi:CHAT domain-containing protein
MKKSLFTLLSILCIFFYQCKEKSPIIAKEKNTQSAIIDSLHQLIALKSQEGQADSVVAALHLPLAFEYYKKFEFPTALATYKKADSIWQKADATRYHANIADNYLNIAGLYDKMGDYPFAINYYQQALNSFIPLRDTGLIIEIYQNMGVAALHAKDSAKIFLLDKGLALIKAQNKPNPYLKAALLQNMGKALADYRHDYMQSLTFLKAAFTLCQSNADTANMAETAIEMAKTYLYKANYSEAIKSANTALSLRQALNKDKMVECFQVLGQIAEAQLNPDSALFFYQKALQIIDTTFKNNDVLINPKIDAKTFNRKIELINLLAHKADPLSILHKKTKNKAYLIAALNTYQLADNIVQVLRREMHDDQAKYFWNETALPIYKKGIDVAYQLFESTQDAQYKLNILQFSERTKAPVLREGIADNQSKSFAGIPAAERQRERELRALIAILEKQTDNNASTGQLTKTRIELYVFQDSLKTKYPTYARYLDATNQILDSKFQIPSTESGIWNLESGIIESIQNQLSDSTLLIEYAFGEKDLYQIVLSNADFKVFKTPLSADSNTQINRFIQSISDIDAIKKDFNASGKDYAETSFDLYQRLLEQPLKAFNANKKVKRIHLILENKLHLFPFKALTDCPVKGWIGDYPKHFLVHQYAFSSLFSIQTLLQNIPSVSEPFSSDLKLACFGLDFKDTALWQQNTPKTGISSKKNNILSNAEPEVRGIASQFNGRFYFNQTATKDAFIHDAPQYDVLHITTHGYPEGLVFQKTNAKDSLHEVSIGDIYSLPLHARFTFLSACETGQGTLTEAEGIMSLGRAFSYAGSQSVIMSLWSIPDGATSNIAQSFYTYYHQGLPKDVAEQRAEIDFLHTASDAQSHPNHWAALTIIGDMAPLKEQKVGLKSWVWYLLVTCALLGLIFGFKRFW